MDNAHGSHGTDVSWLLMTKLPRCTPSKKQHNVAQLLRTMPEAHC